MGTRPPLFTTAYQVYNRDVIEAAPSSLIPRLVWSGSKQPQAQVCAFLHSVLRSVRASPEALR